MLQLTSTNLTRENIAMKKTILYACYALLTLTFTGSVAFGQTPMTISVSGGGKLTYLFTNEAETCYQGGVINYSDYVYGGPYSNAFSYTDVAGNTTNYPDAQIIYVASPGGASCPPIGYDPPSGTVALDAGTDGTVTYSAITNTATLVPPPPPPVTGYLDPKYKIVGVVYSPPGSTSFVQYTDTTMMGTSTSTQSSFSTNESASTTICGTAGFNIFGSTGGSVTICGTDSNSFTQESDTSSSFAVNQTTTFVNKWQGSTNGLNHGNDVVYVWLNPIVVYTVPGSSTGTAVATPVQWNGYSYDTADTDGMEVVPIYLSQLMNPSSIAADDPTLYDRLQRTWAQNNLDGTGPGLTDADLAIIAAADPYSNPDYVPTLASGTQVTTDGRFTATGNQLIYEPGTATSGAPTYSYSWAQTATSTQGSGGKNTYQTGVSLSESFKGGFFGSSITLDLKQGLQWTWVDQWNNLYTQQSGETNQVSITGPAYCAPGSTTCTPYEGPEEFSIFQDNVYGTFMMNPVLSNFTITAAPGSQTVNPGASTTFQLSTAVNNGYTGTLSLALEPGLPMGASGTFSATQISAGSSSTLTIKTSASTPPGTYPLAVEATDGTLIYYAYFNLVVATPNFTITVAPSSQTITVGSGTSYTVTANAVNGFTGNVTISTGALPSGISETFSPNPIPAGSSSTMAISSTSSAAVGTYSLAVYGTSGSLMNAASPDPILIVNPVPPSFTVAATPKTRTVLAGDKSTYTFTTTAVNGFTGVVTLSASGLPTGATAAFSPTTITGGGSSTLTVTTSTSTPAGAYTLTLTGVSGSLTQSTTVTLTVTGFSISVSPSSATAAIENSATYTVTTAALDGFDGVVTLSVVTPPSGSSSSFSPTTITGAGSSTLTMTATGNTLPGTYTFTIKATSGDLTETTTATLVVTGTNFTMSSSPATETVTAGGSTTYTAKTTVVSGFTGKVTLSVTGLPSGATAAFSPTSITGAGESTLTVSTTTSTAAGEYYLELTGTSGTLVQSTQIILHVDN